MFIRAFILALACAAFGVPAAIAQPHFVSYSGYAQASASAGPNDYELVNIPNTTLTQVSASGSASAASKADEVVNYVFPDPDDGFAQVDHIAVGGASLGFAANVGNLSVACGANSSYGPEVVTTISDIDGVLHYLTFSHDGAGLGRAVAHLSFGDTIRVQSTSLSIGSPVTVRLTLHGSLGGQVSCPDLPGQFGGPVGLGGVTSTAQVFLNGGYTPLACGGGSEVIGGFGYSEDISMLYQTSVGSTFYVSANLDVSNLAESVFGAGTGTSQAAREQYASASATLNLDVDSAAELVGASELGARDGSTSGGASLVSLISDSGYDYTTLPEPGSLAIALLFASGLALRRIR
jgi:hypothetical protein